LTKKRGVIVARVSTEEQKRSGFSIPSQIKSCSLKIAADGVEPVHEPIMESESGLTTERDAIATLFDLARQGLDYVYVHTLDRLARNVAEGPYVLYRLRQMGVIVRTPTREYDLSDPMQCVLAMLEFYAAQTESMKIGERTTRGKAEKFLSGKWVGPIPFGYVENAAGELGKIPEQVEVVRAIFEEYCRTASVKETLSIVNSRYSSKHGSFSFDRIRRILSNPIYVGRARWAKHELSTPQYAVIRSDLFEKAQALIEKNNRRKLCANRGRNPKHLLDDLSTQFDTGTVTRFLRLFRPHCPRDNAEMHSNGTKPSKTVDCRLPNFLCGVCGYERTIPSERELETMLAALSCPRCRCTELNTTIEPDGPDDLSEYVCSRCGISFTIRATGSNGIMVKSQEGTVGKNKSPQHAGEAAGSLASPRQMVDVGRGRSNEATGTLERARQILYKLVTSGFNLDPSAFQYLKDMSEVTLETISDSILMKMKEKTLPGGLITKQLLVELLSPA
jgi:DNA invertase Pin-like site-specific DNA recombinase